MARPQKRTVDYFPHYVNSGKTLLILQNEFGNDGYAFWFKLLSLLCKTDGQVYDYNNPASWRLLLAETCINEDIAYKILQLLADIDAIDPNLYLGKIIWVQHLIDNLDDVYRRRQNGSKPAMPVIVYNNLVSVNKSTQTKQDKTKLNKTIIPDFIDKETWNDFLEMRKKLRKIPTEKAKELLIKDLEKLRATGEDTKEVLEQSIMRNYTGVFPVKGGRGGTHQRSSTKLIPRDKYTPPEKY